nr:ATP-binding cassette domain-containing protein [Verrucomicrobium spinosum]
MQDLSSRRLRPEVLAVLLGTAATTPRPQLNIHDITRLAIRDAIPWVRELVLTDLQRTYCEELQKEILKRLDFLDQVGLGYLSLDRESGSLSGGEAQRIRLATQIGAGLAGVLYVLDEPSIGLHPADNERLIGTLKRLRDLGNSVLVVEHDEDTMRAADWIIELGPGAGPLGGRIIAEGTPAQVMRNEHSTTGAYLDHRISIPVPRTRIPWRGSQKQLLVDESASHRDEPDCITIHGAREHNLRNVTVSFPLGSFVCVTGPSGSGKSSLVDAILRRASCGTSTTPRTSPVSMTISPGCMAWTRWWSSTSLPSAAVRAPTPPPMPGPSRPSGISLPSSPPPGFAGMTPAASASTSPGAVVRSVAEMVCSRLTCTSSATCRSRAISVRAAVTMQRPWRSPTKGAASPRCWR